MNTSLQKKLLLSVVTFAGVLVAAGLLGLYMWTGAEAGRAHVVDIPPKSGTANIGQRLEAAGVVRNAGVFRYYAVLSGHARTLKAGEYAFPAGITLPQVVRQLAEGKTIKHEFLVPEGYTARQIAEKLEAEKFASAQAFLDVVSNSATARAWGVPADSLEGFLFPDTYELTKGLDAGQIAQLMVKRFKEKAGDVLTAEGTLTPLQRVTLASIIEREVKVPQERARVASVFYNRMAKRMRLESCATVLYGEGRTGGSVSLADLQSKSPYNTYRHAGLPPGPISNPGFSSLQAAAHPEETEYLFFVVSGDGVHTFSKDFEEHKKAKWAHKKARNSGRP